MVSSGWLCLGAMVIAYGCSNLLQSIAAVRTRPHHTMHPSLLWRLAGQRTYLFGVGCQAIGFTLAFFARRQLPLFLVQASVAAGLGVMAILGVAILKWRLPRAELLLLGLLGFGIAGLVVSAKPGAARPIDMLGIIVLSAVLVVIGVIGIFAARLRGAPGSVALGALAGLAFGAAAIDSRSLANVHSLHALVMNPLLLLLFAHAVVGQLLLGMAMQRGSTTAAVAAMDAASTAPAAIIGLLMLGDQIWPGRQWLAAAGFTFTLVAVLGLTRFAQPQHDHVAEGMAEGFAEAAGVATTKLAAGPIKSTRNTPAMNSPVPVLDGANINGSSLVGAGTNSAAANPRRHSSGPYAAGPYGAGPYSSGPYDEPTRELRVVPLRAAANTPGATNGHGPTNGSSSGGGSAPAAPQVKAPARHGNPAHVQPGGGARLRDEPRDRPLTSVFLDRTARDRTRPTLA